MAMEKPKSVAVLILMLAVSTIACPRGDDDVQVAAPEICHSRCYHGQSLCIVKLCTWIDAVEEYIQCHQTCDQASVLCHGACNYPGGDDGSGGDQAEPPASSMGVPRA